jgi:hypothetical protein
VAIYNVRLNNSVACVIASVEKIAGMARSSELATPLGEIDTTSIQRVES